MNADNNIQSLPGRFALRANVADLPAYTPVEPLDVSAARLGIPVGEIVKLDANENPYGASPRALQALAELETASRYPDPESGALRRALAGFCGVPAENLLVGCGADELIDLLLRVALEPGDAVLNLPPTFGMYAFDTRLNCGRLVEAPRKADFSLDLPAIQAAVLQYRPKLGFLCAPNNPDGSLPPRAEIEALLEMPVMWVVDEAYIEFSAGGGPLCGKQSLIAQVPGRENLVVLRTFSKWAGLAGLRVGYGAFPGWLMPALWKAKQPYNVNTAAAAAAVASLADLDELAQNVAKICAERERLFALLQRVPWLEPYPSQANFILCRVNGRLDARLLKEGLERRGVLVRYYDTGRLRDCIRISVGTPQQSARLLEAVEGMGRGGERVSRRAGEMETGRNGETETGGSRTARILRCTNETNIDLSLDLDGQGAHSIQSGIPFLDHMLTQVAVHGLFDLTLAAQGDLDVDAHHLVEDTALALGEAFDRALGSRAGIVRMASAFCPMDESLAQVTVDFSGRAYAVVQVNFNDMRIGNLPTSLIPHFFESFAGAAHCNLHAHVLYGRDDHHMAEALFKAFGRALDSAVRLDPRREGRIPSSKGVIGDLVMKGEKDLTLLGAKNATPSPFPPGKGNQNPSPIARGKGSQNLNPANCAVRSGDVILRRFLAKNPSGLDPKTGPAGKQGIPRAMLVDAGTGNLQSVSNALRALGLDVLVTSNPHDLRLASRIILPGVGAFGAFMDGLRGRGLDEALVEAAGRGVPLLGICVGMQALFETGEELGEHPGLGLIAGRVVKFAPHPLPGAARAALKIPHTGWNQLWFDDGACPLFNGLEPGCHVYFNHSYYCQPGDPALSAARTAYGFDFTSAVQSGNLLGVQFHPEKSQAVGQKIIRNFFDARL